MSNIDVKSGHTILRLELPYSGFTLGKTFPPTPFVVPAGVTVTMFITLVAPARGGGTYDIAGTVDIS
jgi:hypothetical protein